MRGSATPAAKGTFFRFVIVLKGADGALQLLGGLLLAALPPASVAGVANAVLTRDLIGDSDGTLAHRLTQSAHALADDGGRLFAVGFLMAHGLVKLALAFGLLKRVLSAYPVAMVTVTAFIVFEVARGARTGSVALAALALFDVIVLIVVVHAFGKLQSERARRY